MLERQLLFSFLMENVASKIQQFVPFAAPLPRSGNFTSSYLYHVCPLIGLPPTGDNFPSTQFHLVRPTRAFDEWRKLQRKSRQLLQGALLSP